MLFAEPNDVRSPLTGETQQRQRKPCLRSNRMPLFKLANLINRPRMIPRRSSPDIRHVARRIEGRKFLANAEFKSLPDCLHARVGGFGKFQLPVPQHFDRIRGHLGEWDVAEELRRARGNRFLKGRLKDQPTNVARSWIKPLIVRAFGEVFRAKPTPRADANAALGGLPSPAHRIVIGGHKLRRPRRAAKPNLGPTLHPIIDPNVAMAVSVLHAPSW
jgi:hypothetical protein